MSDLNVKVDPIVYVVDDDPQTCKAVSELVHTFGHQVQLFESPTDFPRESR